MRPRCLLLALSVVAAACAPPPSTPEASGPPVALERIGRIGCGDCDDARQNTPVVLAILDDERIAVLDGFEPFVRVFDSDGDLQLFFGRKGEGPGELGQALPGGAYLPGLWLFGNELGGVTILDIFPFSLEVFDGEGSFVTRTETGLSDAVPTAQAYDAATRSYYRISFSPLQDDSRRISRCRFSAIDQADCDDFADPVPFLQQEGMPGASLGSLALAAGPDGSLVVANVGSYEIWVLSDQGEVVMRTGRDLPFPEKSAEESDSERQAWARLGRPNRELDPNRLHIASYGLQVDGDGRIWVLTERYDEDNSVFDVFAPDGTYLAEVAIDAVVRRTSTGITPFVARGSLLAAAAQRPDGDNEVWVYRIHAPVAPIE